MVLRCLQSAGSSGTIALGSAVVADLTTRAERGKYIGYSSMGISLGPALGPIIGMEVHLLVPRYSLRSLFHRRPHRFARNLQGCGRQRVRPSTLVEPTPLDPGGT
jgi:hypothetical protein